RARSARVGLGVEGAAHRVVDVGGFLRDLPKVAGDVEDLRRRWGIVLQAGPVGPAVLQVRRCGRQKAILITRSATIEVVRRTEVTVLRRLVEWRRAGRTSWAVAPLAVDGCLTGCLPVGRRADRAAHSGAGLLDLVRTDVEPRDFARHRAGWRL